MFIKNWIYPILSLVPKLWSYLKHQSKIEHICYDYIHSFSLLFLITNMSDILTFSCKVRTRRNEMGFSIFTAANGLVGGASASCVRIGTTAFAITSLFATLFSAKDFRRDPMICWRDNSKLRLSVHISFIFKLLLTSSVLN